jgi:hypothetical protein
MFMLMIADRSICGFLVELVSRNIHVAFSYISFFPEQNLNRREIVKYSLGNYIFQQQININKCLK